MSEDNALTLIQVGSNKICHFLAIAESSYDKSKYRVSPGNKGSAYKVTIPSIPSVRGYYRINFRDFLVAAVYTNFCSFHFGVNVVTFYQALLHLDGKGNYPSSFNRARKQFIKYIFLFSVINDGECFLEITGFGDKETHIDVNDYKNLILNARSHNLNDTGLREFIYENISFITSAHEVRIPNVVLAKECLSMLKSKTFRDVTWDNLG